MHRFQLRSHSPKENRPGKEKRTKARFCSRRPGCADILMDRPKIGLALGGGGALGFAHLGVLQVLEEEKIPIDMIAGCSMGSLLGGIYASGCALDRLIDFARTFNRHRYMDPNVPFTSNGLFGGDKVEELIKTMTSAISFAQCKIPFMCLATCLEEASAVYFGKDSDVPMYRAIRASISLPMIFEPVTMNGMTLVDGGVMDRSALTALVQMQPDVRLACDVSYHGTPLGTPKTTKEVLMDSYDILSWHAVEPHLALASVQIIPDTSAFSGSSYSDSDIAKLIEVGAKTAKAAIPQIREVIDMTGK